MQFLAVILTIVLVSLSTAIPTQTTAAVVPAGPAELQTKWMLDGVSRIRTEDKKTCHWYMTITESTTTTSNATSTPTPTPSNTNSTSAPVHCHFRVLAPSGHDCGIGNFGPVKCSPSNHGFYVNAGHNSQNGFYVLVIVNTDENKQAYFGVSDSELDSGASIPPQTSPADDIDSDDSD
ncbi:hypothetical protein F5Y10DRAFT_55767 [Nemania abortiva]|nr:hypothetical protein F5Y10DRAFT_55767 [Nemania abortiva]